MEFVNYSAVFSEVAQQSEVRTCSMSAWKHARHIHTPHTPHTYTHHTHTHTTHIHTPHTSHTTHTYTHHTHITHHTTTHTTLCWSGCTCMCTAQWHGDTLPKLQQVFFLWGLCSKDTSRKLAQRLLQLSARGKGYDVPLLSPHRLCSPITPMVLSNYAVRYLCN